MGRRVPGIGRIFGLGTLTLQYIFGSGTSPILLFSSHFN